MAGLAKVFEEACPNCLQSLKKLFRVSMAISKAKYGLGAFHYYYYYYYYYYLLIIALL